MEIAVALAQVIATLFVAVALVFSWRQARVMEESFKDLQAARARQQFYDINRYLDEVRHEIEVVLALDGKELDQWTKEEVASAFKICSRLHLLGILVIENHVPERLLAYAWYYSIPKCAEILGPYLAKIREQRGSMYWSAVDSLAQRVTRHQGSFAGFS